MRRRTFFGSLVLGTVLIACSQIGDVKERSSASPQHTNQVWNDQGDGPRIHEVLITIDGTRWQEIFHGSDDAMSETAGIPVAERMTADELTPNIHALLDSGIGLGDDGSPFVASGPNYVSLPGYVEMLSGHSAACQENNCEDRPLHTIADAFREAGAKQEDVAVFTSWEPIGIAATHDPNSIVMSNGRSAGSAQELFAADTTTGPLLNEGRAAEAEPGHDTYRPDRYTAPLAISYFKEYRPRFMFVGLGDTDEYGHKGDYAGYVDALRDADDTVGELVDIANEWKAEGDKVVFMVTSDHGREEAFRDHGRDHPESAATWLVASGDGISDGSLLIDNAPRRLADIAPTLEAIAGLSSGADETGVAMTELLAKPGGEERTAVARN